MQRLKVVKETDEGCVRLLSREVTVEVVPKYVPKASVRETLCAVCLGPFKPYVMDAQKLINRSEDVWRCSSCNHLIHKSCMEVCFQCGARNVGSELPELEKMARTPGNIVWSSS